MKFIIGILGYGRVGLRLCAFLTCACLLSFSDFASATKVGLVLDPAGKDDKSFNESAFRGLTEIANEKSIDTKVVESPDQNGYETMMQSFAKKGYDLIIAVGVSQQEALRKVATRNPKVSFAIIDAEVDLPNVRSILFEEHEGSYLAGALAAMKSKSKKIGFVGGMDIPLIRRFHRGYEAGAKSINPKIEVVANYVGVTSDAWSNPPKGKELALAQYDRGIDIIFVAAGTTGLGVFEAADARKKFAIGVDSNQNYLKPGRILTSMLKNIDRAVKEAVSDVDQKQFRVGLFRYGLANRGVGLAFDQHNASLVTASDRQALQKIEQDIVSKKIQVPDYYKSKL